MITIIDYGMGNLASVQKAFAKLGYESHLTSSANDVKNAEKLLLPGVGAFGAAIKNLDSLGLIEPIRTYCESDRPFLGICLGMQLLMTRSDEHGSWDGLDIIPGRVGRFYENTSVPEGLKIPHMGWNSLEVKKNDGVLQSVRQGDSVYFVHSYYVIPDDENVIAATSTHGETFCASLARENIFATQFHPEKSGKVGLSILKSFGELSV
jgi:imidazole glycerol-phosphate synthase subunit HisH